MEPASQTGRPVASAAVLLGGSKHQLAGSTIGVAPPNVASLTPTLDTDSSPLGRHRQGGSVFVLWSGPWSPVFAAGMDYLGPPEPAPQQRCD
jgi:hypothetical protein